MLLHALLLPLALGPLPVQEKPIEGSDEHSHGGDFASMLEHRAFPDLMRWKERYPWRVGTEVRKFTLRLEEERAKGDPEIDRVWNMHAAFLAEALVDDVYTAWLITMMNYDVEARATFDTVRLGLADVAASIRTRKDLTDEAIVAEIAGLRAPIAPPWCFESCVEELTKIAEAAQTAGRHQAAIAVAREAQSIAHRTRDGEIALWCATFLLRAEPTVRKLLEVARELEQLPPDFEKTLADVREVGGVDTGVGVGIETFRAVRAEMAGQEEEALARWNAAAEKSLPIRQLRGYPPDLDGLETVLYGPDPLRRGALLSARMGRTQQAWKLARIATSNVQSFDDAAEEDDRKKVFSAGRLDGMLLLLADHENSLAAWSGAEGIRVAVIPIGLEKIREMILEMRPHGTAQAKPPAGEYDPAAARRFCQTLLEPLRVPVRGRVGVFHTKELSELPLGMLVVGEKAEPTRPEFLIERAALFRMVPSWGGWEVDAATLEAVKKRMQELGGGEEAIRAVQLEMIEGRGPLGASRKHPWFWAGLELERP